MDALKAKKDFRKLLKKTDIKKTLDDIEDYASFYANDDDSNIVDEDQDEDDSDREKLDGMFATEREKEFYDYGKDIDFVRYHKRTTRNFLSGL